MWPVLLVLQITAGEQIDLMFGAKLGLSSMMAAGLGNTVADVVGINISHTIEVGFLPVACSVLCAELAGAVPALVELGLLYVSMPWHDHVPARHSCAATWKE